MGHEEDILAHLRSLNPKPEEQAILIYGSKYRLYKDDEFIGEGFWTQDNNVGDSFQQKRKTKEGGIISTVFAPVDYWELIPKKIKQ